MPKKTITVEIEASGYDLVEAVATAVKAVKAAKAAGGGVPAEVAAGLTAALSVAAEVSQVAGDLAESKEEFLKGVLVASADLYDAIVS